ncbi:SDR family oxidoreductase [Pikeienuella piscinae]|uniref:SDR family oxidoreductase n=1 Tax=Pikeienuella piscinae TaxID=2748098 RepID=A0A7L5BZA9_9RHOB|nr:SDR family oxidoreductase [Pikeienuella piscinae]QIE56168.1 SDR family oxidoreductase [Pikeienuella piscinae]
MRQDINGWTIWITGAGSGIGAAMARAFADAGCVVALTARSPDPLNALAAEITAAGGTALVHAADVRDRDGLARIAREIAGETGRLDLLCNNAGLNIPKRRWAEIDWESWDAVIDVNVKGALNAIAAALPIMRAQGGGVVINTSSWAGRFHSAAGGVPYGASKHALTDISASLNSEEGANGVRSTALCPAEVATPLMTRRPGYDPAAAAAMIQPEDLADAALFVARMNPNVAIHEIAVAPVRR